MFFIVKNHWEPSFTDNPRNFNLPIPSSCSMALGFNQPLTEMSTEAEKKSC
jgi:hypothetical protein